MAVDKRYAICARCGQRWQIGDREIPGTGYICPKCATRRSWRPAIKWCGLTLLAVALFWIARGQAQTARGCDAVGGELLILGLPFYWDAIGRTIKDWAGLIKEVKNDK